jgi:hypothetical protein
MNQTLLLVGIACVVAAVVGGGLKLAGTEFPLLTSTKRQAMLGIIGVAVAGGSFAVPEADTKATPTPSPTRSVRLPTGLPSFPDIPDTIDDINDGPVTLELSKESGPPGTSLRVSGTGFQPGEQVKIVFHTEVMRVVQANTKGSFIDVAVEVPSDWPFRGQFSIRASGAQSLKSTDLPFRVT